MDDPSALLSAILAQCGPDTRVEILLYDDGTQDAELEAQVGRLARDANVQTTLIIADTNTGRSTARNYLQSQAGADWVLFLDADMSPQNANFIDNYLSLIAANKADIIFGGFAVERRIDDPDRELHRFFSECSDCHPLHIREKAGPQYVATSNLCIRRSVVESERFDNRFKGWGWEDSEWAARVNKKYDLLHVDNPAIHLGMETTDTLLRRFKESADNYVLFTQTHPEFATSLALYRAAQRLKTIPCQKIMRPFLNFIVRRRLMPLSLRVIALKLWRASWYAEAFS